MTITDIVTLILSFLFFIRGASRGFMRSLIVPFSILIATIISIIYYQITKDVIVSLLIGLFGPLLLHFILRFLLKTWAHATNSEIKPSFLSRLGGALLTLAWGWVFIIFALILLAVLPPWGKILTSMHDDVTNSLSYFVVRPLGNDLFADTKQNVAAVADVASTSNSDAQSLALDPRFQKILQDPEIQKEIDAHDIVKLMSNPKMIDLTQELMRDPATMKKVLAIYSSQTNPQATKNP